MGELLFIATVIFVAYVVFVVIGEKKETSEPSKTDTVKPETETLPIDQPVINESKTIDPPPAAVKVAAKPVRAKSAAAKPAPAKKASAAAPATAPASAEDSLKNPKTGEVAKIPNTYTFAKRWIKDALVEEGLLDKVYKNSELDDAANAKIQLALQQLKAMDKYR